MAIVQTAVVNNPDYKSWTITALDADTTVTFAHGFVNAAGASVTPDMVFIQELVTYANAALPNWGVSVAGANITLTKQGAAGSGTGLGNIAKLFAMLPHSIMQ